MSKYVAHPLHKSLYDVLQTSVDFDLAWATVGGEVQSCNSRSNLTLKVLVATIDAQWEGVGDVGSARYEPALLPPCPTIRVLSYSNK